MIVSASPNQENAINSCAYTKTSSFSAFVRPTNPIMEAATGHHTIKQKQQQKKTTKLSNNEAKITKFKIYYALILLVGIVLNSKM